MHFLGRHLNTAHGLTTAQYRELFPGAATRSEECQANRSKSQRKAWEAREDREAAGQRLKAGRSEDSYRKMANTKKTQYAAMTEEQRQEVLGKMHRMSAMFHNNPDHEEARASRAAAISKSWTSRIESDPAFYEAARQRMLRANSVMHEWLRTCSQEDLAEYLDGSFLRKPKKYEFEYCGRIYAVRSSYEVEVLKALVDLNLEFKYEPFMLRRSDGSLYRFDFLVEGCLVLEVKADYWHNLLGRYTVDKAAVESAGYAYGIVREKEIFGGGLHAIIGELTTSARQSRVTETGEIV